MTHTCGTFNSGTFNSVCCLMVQYLGSKRVNRTRSLDLRIHNQIHIMLNKYEINIMLNGHFAYFFYVKYKNVS